MAGFKNKFIQFVNKGVDIIPFKVLQKVACQNLILPFYHTISDEEIPHLKHLYAVKGVQAFVNDLDFLLSKYTPIDYTEFQKLTSEDKKLEKPSFLLSFDDGLSEFQEIIAPILLQKGVPAICFLNSGFIDNRDLFFRYKASLIIEQLEKEPELIKKVQEILGHPTQVYQKIVSISYQDKDLLDKLAASIDYSFTDYLATQSPYLTSEQIKSLINKGFHVGAHSIDHPEYQYINFQEQVRQTKESIQFICDTFSLGYKTFSFPFTDYKVTQPFFNYLQANNIAETTFGCAGPKNDAVSTNFQRIPFEMNGLSAEEILKSEFLYYLLKTPFGRNTMKRND
jgi:peptidoglycan/xylan/chitin deacetylase (PgdA/CDA1 family)